MSYEEAAMDFVLGALGAAQRELVARQRLHNADLDDRICALEAVLAELAYASGKAAPPHALWEGFCDQVTRERCASADGSFECCSAGAWNALGPGIDAKPLWSDKALLIRCMPGAFEPAHQQPEDEDEHILVVAGYLMVGGRALATGDYIRIAAGRVHPVMSTMDGCLLFTEYAAPALRA